MTAFSCCDDVQGPKYENRIRALRNYDFESSFAHNACAFSAINVQFFRIQSRRAPTYVFTRAFRGNRRRPVILFYCAHVRCHLGSIRRLHIYANGRCIVRSRWLTLFPRRLAPSRTFQSVSPMMYSPISAGDWARALARMRATLCSAKWNRGTRPPVIHFAFYVNCAFFPRESFSPNP